MRFRLMSIISVIILIGLMSTAVELVSAQHPFLEKYYYPKVLVVCFTDEGIGNRRGIIDYSVENGIVKTSMESFNRLAEKFTINELEQLHANVTVPDWNSNGIYLQHIYRVHLEANENIEAAIAAISKDKNVVFAEYESQQYIQQYIPNDPDYRQQWHHPAIFAPEAWEYVRGSDEIVVAITDTGTKWNHPDLADNIWINEAELPGITIDWINGQILGGDGIDNDGNGYVDDVMGWDFYDRNNNPYQNYDGNSHGTHVAGIVGSVGDNNIGITGVAMNVSLMNLKGSASNHNSQGITGGYQQIQYAAQTGAHIINCSWISYNNQGGYANSVVDYATSLGALVVAGAGNDNVEHTPGFQAYPSDANNALSVAATGPNDIKANFSDFGAPIGISAPGVNILSTWRENGYNSISGTSMASPVVAGVAALIKSMHPYMSPLDLKERLILTSDSIDEINPNYAGLLGMGRVNAFTAAMFDKIPKLSVFDVEVYELTGDGDGVPNPGEEVSISVSIYNDFIWSRATNVSVTITTNMPGVEIIAGTIQYSDIDGGSVAFNNTNPFKFRTDPNISELTIPFEIIITSNQADFYPYQITDEIIVELSLQKARWPLSLEGTSSSPALIADINTDGMNEIVFGDNLGNLHVMREDKTYLPGFPVNLESNINSGAAAADLNQNNRVELVANTSAGFVNCIDSEGNIVFQYDTGGQIRSNPMLVDVNNDNHYEIVTVTFTSPKLVVLNNDGTDYPGFPVALSSGVISSPTSADMNNDGYKEIIFVTANGNLHVISTQTGDNIEGFPVDIGATSWNGPSIGDVSGNNRPEIVVATVQGHIYGYDGTGNRILHRVAGSPIRTSVTAFDLNSDGNSELIFADMTGRLFVIDKNGENVAPFPINVGSSVESTPILADMNNDRNFEIIFGDGSGHLHSISLSGEQTPNFPINLRRPITVSPAIGYVGESNTLDILVPNQNGYQFIDFKHRGGSIGWSTFKGNIRRTGNNFDMLSVEDINVEPDLITRLKGNYPNPFNPDTTIKYSVGESSKSETVPVNISIYNVRGQVIRTLVDDNLPSGEYSIHWQGTNDSGASVSSGIYFYRLQTIGENGAETQTKKMMLMK